MKKPTILMDKLWEKLISAHRAKSPEPILIEAEWRQSVMRSVRQIHHKYEDRQREIRFDRLVWRLAPAAFVMVMILGYMVLQIGTSLEYQFAELMAFDPAQTYVNTLSF